MNTFWYIMRVLPGKEHQITNDFNDKISLGKINNIIRFICPTEKETVMVRNKKITRDKVIYSGYIYFESETKLSEDDLKHVSLHENIMSMSGSKIPVLMRKNDIDRIIKDDELEDRVQHQLGKYLVGEKVIIIDGPFDTFNGVVKEVNGSKITLDVMVFERPTKVTVNNQQIKQY